MIMKLHTFRCCCFLLDHNEFVSCRSFVSFYNVLSTYDKILKIYLFPFYELFVHNCFICHRFSMFCCTFCANYMFNCAENYISSASKNMQNHAEKNIISLTQGKTLAINISNIQVSYQNSSLHWFEAILD